jgi:hypothetical protein
MSEARQRGNQPYTPAGDAPRADDVLRPANRASNSFVERVSTKVHAVFWVAAAALLLTRGQVLDAAADPSRSSPFFIYLFLACLTVLLTIMLYCVLWVRRVQGSGTFVAELHQVSSQLTIRDVQEEVTERGHIHGTRVITVETVRAPQALAQRMGLRTGQPVFHTVLIHLENGVPIQHEDRYVNPLAAPDYLKTDFSQTTPTRHLLDHAPLTQASRSGVSISLRPR